MKTSRDEKTVLNAEQNRFAGVPRLGLTMQGTRKSPDAAPEAAAPDSKALEAIGRALGAHYADLVQAPLPEKLVELLARLKVGDRASALKGSGDANG